MARSRDAAVPGTMIPAERNEWKNAGIGMDFCSGIIYYKLMVKLVLMLGAAGCCWLGMARGQDVASPPMPEVDDFRQTPEWAREREAVARYMFFWALCERIVLLESEGQRNFSEGMLVKRLLDLMPERASDGCPEAFRKGWLEPFGKIRNALNANPEWRETPEGTRQMGEIEETLKYLDNRYGVKRMMDVGRKWLNGQLGIRAQENPAEVLKKLSRLKNDFASGKKAVPPEVLRPENEEEEGD